MNPTNDELQKIRFAATISGELDEYVYLREPVKCACWMLSEPSVPEMVLIPIEIAMKFYNSNTFNTANNETN